MIVSCRYFLVGLMIFIKRILLMFIKLAINFTNKLIFVHYIQEDVCTKQKFR